MSRHEFISHIQEWCLRGKPLIARRIFGCVFCLQGQGLTLVEAPLSSWRNARPSTVLSMTSISRFNRIHSYKALCSFNAFNPALITFSVPSFSHNLVSEVSISLLITHTMFTYASSVQWLQEIWWTISMNATSMQLIKPVSMLLLVAASSLNGHLCGTHNSVPFLPPYLLRAHQQTSLLWATVNCDWFVPNLDFILWFLNLVKPPSR